MEYIIKKAIEENPKMTSQEIIKQNKKLCNISSRTVRRILKEKFGLISYVAVKKPLLTQDLKKKRLAFAKKYSYWTNKFGIKFSFLMKLKRITHIIWNQSEKKKRE